MIIESLLLFYHINCFKCCVCHVQLGDGLNGTDVRVRNQKLHCQNCYSSDDGIKFSCVQNGFPPHSQLLQFLLSIVVVVGETYRKHMFKVRTQEKSQYQLYKRKNKNTYIIYKTHNIYIWTSLSAYNVNHRRIMQHVQFAVRINVFRFVFLTFYIYMVYIRVHIIRLQALRFFVRCFLPKSKSNSIHIYIYIFIYISIYYMRKF